MTPSSDPHHGALPKMVSIVSERDQDSGVAAAGPYAEPDAPDAAEYDYPYDDQDAAEEDDFGFGEDDCGRWLNGKLTHSCTLAGTEDCDWECPLRGSL